MSDHVQDLNAEMARSRLGDIVSKGKKPVDILWKPILMDVATLLDAMNIRDALVTNATNPEGDMLCLDMGDIAKTAATLVSGGDLSGEFLDSTATLIMTLSALIDRDTMVEQMQAETARRACRIAAEFDDEVLARLGQIMKIPLTTAHLRMMAKSEGEQDVGP